MVHSHGSGTQKRSDLTYVEEYRFVFICSVYQFKVSMFELLNALLICKAYKYMLLLICCGFYVSLFVSVSVSASAQPSSIFKVVNNFICQLKHYAKIYLFLTIKHI